MRYLPVAVGEPSVRKSLAEPLHLLPRSPRMSLRADTYRQKAAETKQSAAQAKNPSLKSAFEEVARGRLVLAEQIEWIDSQKLPPY